MRKGKQWGIELVLTENEHKSLLERFNDRNAKFHIDKPRSHYEIKRKCILCKEYYDEDTSSCDGCPMEVFNVLTRGRYTAPCNKFIIKLLGHTFVERCSTASTSIFWFMDNDAMVREGLRQIRKALLEMKRF